jgi:tetratricopeptide (TPR) repeat protein
MKVWPRVVLWAVVLGGVIAAYVGRDAIFANIAGVEPVPELNPSPLPGPNTISGVVVKRDDSGRWIAEFDYYYSGTPVMTRFVITTVPDLGVPSPPWNNPMQDGPVPRLLRGKHHARMAVPYPGRDGTTTQVIVGFRGGAGGIAPVASQQVPQVIEWPTLQTWQIDRQLAREPPDVTLKQAISLIDLDDQRWLPNARVLLEKLLERDPRFDPAYIELARVAMKSNWGPEGWRQAETLLLSARGLNPENANAKILLAYVYSQQRLYAKAEALLADAAKSDTPNLWLWENWGELLALQGKYDEAVVKYREAIARPMTHDTYDRARKAAYIELLKLLERRKDLDGMEALYKQRVAEFGPGACYTKDYARFLLDVRGDPQGAIDLARRALNQNCDDAPARQILGVSEYVVWASATGPASAEALNQAHIYLPMSAHALFALASGERSSTALKALVVAGEKIDQQDNEHMTALAHALTENDLVAARRLLAAGARADTPVTSAGVPLALLPVMEGRLDAVQLLRRFGTDYKKIRFHGTTAYEIARQTGNSALADALAEKSVAL